MRPRGSNRANLARAPRSALRLGVLLTLLPACPKNCSDGGSDGGTDGPAPAIDAAPGIDAAAAPPDAGVATAFSLGVEYAEPGLAAAYGAAGVRMAKTRLEVFTWGASEPRAPTGGRHVYDWTCTDQAVREYQAAGFDLQSYLSPSSPWASTDLPRKDIMPRPEHLGDYEAWVQALMERYDGDGHEDMPGLVRPLLRWVVAGEWSGFWGSGNADDYLDLLARTRRVALATDARIKLGLIPFLLTDVFAGNPPSAQQIADRLRDPPPWFRNSTAGMMQLLDRGDLYDYVDLHSLGHYTEIPPMIAWLRGELARRGLSRPIWIDDAFPMPVLATGGPIAVARYPVTPVQLASVYDLVLRVADLADPQHDASAAWLEAQVAIGLTQKAVVAAASGVAGLQIGNTEDWAVDTQVEGLFGRKQSAYLIGAAAFMGLVDVAHPGGYDACKPRVAGALRPAWRDVELVSAKLRDFTAVEKLADLGAGVWAYRFRTPRGDVTVAWHEDDVLELPGAEETSVEVAVPVSGATAARVTWTVTDVAAPAPRAELRAVSGGVVKLSLRSIPVFVEPSGAAPSCSAAGSWRMVSVLCGQTDVTNDVRTTGGIDTMRLAISDAGAGCHIVATFAGPTCTEVEERDATPQASGAFTTTSVAGITSCKPLLCTFNANDEPCRLGDRSGTSDQSTGALVGGQLVVTSAPPAGLCQRFGLVTQVTYARE